MEASLSTLRWTTTTMKLRGYSIWPSSQRIQVKSPALQSIRGQLHRRAVAPCPPLPLPQGWTASRWTDLTRLLRSARPQMRRSHLLRLPIGTFGWVLRCIVQTADFVQ